MRRSTPVVADTEASPAVLSGSSVQLEKTRPNVIQQHGRRALLDLTERAGRQLDDVLAKGRLFVTLDREAFERRLQKQRGRAAERRRFEEPRRWEVAPASTTGQTAIVLAVGVTLALALLHWFTVLWPPS